MESIRDLAKQCLAAKPKLNNISKLLQLLTQSSTHKEKLICCRQLARIFHTLHHQDLHPTGVDPFLKGKI